MPLLYTGWFWLLRGLAPTFLRAWALAPLDVRLQNCQRLQPQPTKQFADSLSGLIERATFFNEENGYAVLKVKAKGHRDLVIVVGSLSAANAGEWVTAEGRWVQDREFGLQFRAEMLTSTALILSQLKPVEAAALTRAELEVAQPLR
jgi:hypothetical protein